MVRLNKEMHIDIEIIKESLKASRTLVILKLLIFRKRLFTYQTNLRNSFYCFDILFRITVQLILYILSSLHLKFFIELLNYQPNRLLQIKTFRKL